jgi:hypothetical protein
MTFQVYMITDKRVQSINGVEGIISKIGKSCVTYTRLRKIIGQESFMGKGTLYILITLDSEEDMNLLERKLHKHFKHLHAGKEWFVVELEDVIKYVDKFAKSHKNVTYEIDPTKLSLFITPLKLRMDDPIIIGRDVTTTRAKRTIQERIIKLQSILTASPSTTPSQLLNNSYKHYKSDGTVIETQYSLKHFTYDFKYGYFVFA